MIDFALEAERHEGVDAEARRQSERDVREDAHRDGRNGRGKRGHGEQRWELQLYAGTVLERAEDRRVHEQDVRHRREGDEPGDDLGAHGRPAFRDLEVALEEAARGMVIGSHERRR